MYKKDIIRIILICLFSVTGAKAQPPAHLSESGMDASSQYTPEQIKANVKEALINLQIESEIQESNQFAKSVKSFEALPKEQREKIFNDYTAHTDHISCTNDGVDVKICRMQELNNNAIEFQQPQWINQIYFKNRQAFKKWDKKQQLIDNNCQRLNEQFETTVNKVANDIITLKSKDQNQKINADQAIAQLKELFLTETVEEPYYVFNIAKERQVQIYNCYEKQWSQTVDIPDDVKELSDCQHPEMVKKLGIEKICS